MTELSLLQGARSDVLLPCHDPTDPREWARFGFFVALRLLDEIRSKRFHIRELHASLKEDGSPFTRFEESIERYCRDVLSGFYAAAGFYGEETGHTPQLADDRPVCILDPIDGTRSFLSGFDSFALTLSIVKGKEPLFSLVGNPATGDLAFRIGKGNSKIVGLPLFSGDLDLVDLPLFSGKSSGSLLVNVHPSEASKPYIDRLYSLWGGQKIGMVKSVSGSPSWQIIEACKGDIVYLNTWSSGITMPFDLVAAFHLMEGAKAMALSAEGKKVDPWNHHGIFFVGSNPDHLALLLDNLD